MREREPFRKLQSLHDAASRLSVRPAAAASCAAEAKLSQATC